MPFQIPLPQCNRGDAYANICILRTQYFRRQVVNFYMRNYQDMYQEYTKFLSLGN